MKVNIREVTNAKERRNFLNYPLELYKGNPCFIPPLYADEKKIFSPDYVYHDTCESVFFNAYDDFGKQVGRISGILQKASNEKRKEKRVRFTRFDAVNDTDVAKALFGAVEAWAVGKGMDTVCGPLGYSDLEREGLLIEGFDQPNTFEEQYNYDYYPALVEACGYAKEVDWVESQLRLPAEDDGNIAKLTQMILKRYNLRMGEAKNINDFITKYGDKIFELLDSSYDDIYGTVPFTEGMKKMMIDNFRLLIDMRFVYCILDENDRIVCFGLALPSIAEAVKKSNGHLTPAALVRILRSVKHPKVIDLALVGVAPEYLNKGLTAVFIDGLYRMLREKGVDHAETNLNIEDNFAIRNCWKRFDQKENKRRRSYVKSLKTGEEEG